MGSPKGLTCFLKDSKESCIRMCKYLSPPFSLLSSHHITIATLSDAYLSVCLSFISIVSNAFKAKYDGEASLGASIDSKKINEKF